MNESWNNPKTTLTEAAAGVRKPGKPTPGIVNDDELLALLHDTSAALVRMPEGSSTLFIIES